MTGFEWYRDSLRLCDAVRAFRRANVGLSQEEADAAETRLSDACARFAAKAGCPVEFARDLATVMADAGVQR